MLRYKSWRVGGSYRKYSHSVTPSCKLDLARFSAGLKIQDEAECSNYLLTFDIYHNGRRSEIRSVEEKEDYLLSDEIRPGGLEDNLITDKLLI